MSLISDALKTAQRARSGKPAGSSGDEPLLEGFFPYVSSSESEKSAGWGRPLAVSLAAVVVLGGIWLALPALKRAGGGRPDLPPTATSRIIAPPPVAPTTVAAQTVDTQPSTPVVVQNPSAATVKDSTPVVERPVVRVPTTETKRVVARVDNRVTIRQSRSRRRRCLSHQIRRPPVAISKQRR